MPTILKSAATRSSRSLTHITGNLRPDVSLAGEDRTPTVRRDRTSNGEVHFQGNSTRTPLFPASIFLLTLLRCQLIMTSVG